jgi:hypothetical protein
MVIAKVLDVQILNKDYIWIKIEYDVGGKKVINSYPMDFKNVVGKTNQEILNWIKINVEYQCDRYIEAEFRKKVNPSIIQQKLPALIGKEYIKDSAILQFDTNKDGVADKEWEIKIDGTYIEKEI